MLMIDYSDSDFEKKALQFVESKDEFLVRIQGWKGKSIAKGLEHYRFHIIGQKVRSLRLIPHGLIAPTFWTVCIQAGFKSLWPDWRFEESDLIVRFAKRI